MRTFLSVLLLLFLTCNTCKAQQYIYVNTDSLLLRSDPEKVYYVYMVLHAPSRLAVEPYNEHYKLNKAVTDRFYQVSFTFKKPEGGNNTKRGWVEKKYTVMSKSQVTFPGADTSISFSGRHIPQIPHIGFTEFDPEEANYRDFPFPKYQGGERGFPGPVKRVYHKGPRGGCYYIGAAGQKKYVNPKLCK